MKTRIGFVSNSSSCSFIIKKADLTQSQEYIVENYQECALKSTEAYPDEVNDWTMYEYANYYNFRTFMDNFSLNEFFESMGILVEQLKYD